MKRIINQSSIWKNGIFMRMFASYSVSMMGHYFDMIAIMIIFGYVWQADPILIALIPVAIALPQAILGQFSGVFADRVNKVKLMMVADVLTSLLTLLLFLASNPWWALLIISLRSIVNVVHFPAQQGLIKLVVPENQLVKAASLNGIVMQLSKIIAPFIGGILASATSPQICILINAIAFFLSSLILLTILVQKKIELSQTVQVQREGDVHQPTFWQSWREGWVIIVEHRILWVSFLISFVGLLFIQMIDVQYTTWFREIAPNRQEILGWLFAASGLGAVMMMLFLNRYEHLRGYGWLLGGSLVCIGIGFGGVGLLQIGFQLWLPIVYGIVVGIGVALYSIGFQYIIQKHTSKETIGRISGISNSIASFCVVLAPLIGGFLVQNWGAGTIFISIGIICTLIGSLAILFQKRLWKEKEADFEKNVGHLQKNM
ncbi:MFS transporter [Ferdinandcohnia quinoae]|uniref:MFS transporter n=1 Tax=Fredinandcohnia quinoae TaxID=2918902 RepID=UPI001F06809D|nr:MFS transporter [Fredinandcohnia sp. SECRCQ15]